MTKRMVSCLVLTILSVITLMSIFTNDINSVTVDRRNDGSAVRYYYPLFTESGSPFRIVSNISDDVNGEVAPYLDVLSATVETDDYSTLRFNMTFRGSLPDAEIFSNRTLDDTLSYAWWIDADGNSSTGQHHEYVGSEYNIMFQASGGSPTGEWGARVDVIEPESPGGGTVQFSINENMVSLIVGFSQIGDAASFRWSLTTWGNLNGTFLGANPETLAQTVRILYRFDVTWGFAIERYITINCNHDLILFNFDKSNKELSIVVTGDESGFCRIIIPRNRLDCPFVVTIDETEVIYDMSQSENTSCLLFTYVAGTHYIKVTGTERGYIVGDLNDDGTVNILDIAIVAVNFGNREEDYTIP